MTRQQLEHAIRAAGAIAGDPELFVVGSQAILGAFPNAHPDLCRSMEVDIAPKNRPELDYVRVLLRERLVLARILRERIDATPGLEALSQKKLTDIVRRLASSDGA